MKNLRVYEGSMMYLITGVLFIGVSIVLAYVNTSIEAQLILTQYLIIGMPPVLYLWVKKKPISQLLRLHKISVKTTLLIILITLLSYPIAVVMNTLIMLILSLFGSIDIPQVPTAETSQQYVLYLLIIAFSAGLCEEVLFRGFIMRSFEKVGYKFAIFFSALLFGVFHFNIYNLGATIFFGILFGYLVVLTNSLWAGIIGHIANNAFAVTLGFLVNHMQEYSQDILAEAGEIPGAEMISTVEILMAIGLFGFIALGTGFGALIILKYLRKVYRHQEPLTPSKQEVTFVYQDEHSEQDNGKEESYQLKEFWPIIPIFIIFVVMTGAQLYQVVAGSTLF
ncbi:type II CAAX endopeptidase family protein [Isachenkonia alkalipeptolytica]|uniref:CPBP family intramembrane metalloprotease n=1 Tax=Isachenkonia alkalipeptolytica TaxID=2565777 RepID=A0AA44BEP5_9CLOT|nr:type II CAAX endopeptidase family protein [Isachenkonia alkalipeptolytica]NBG89489.1 CPBP family intramembrane metalloprotease [Isachenkonia alkalipeptolytica]